jgi:putative nucleotidyltransferase with HDIG domain
MLVGMPMTRQSRYSTVFVAVLVFTFVSQSMLLGPNINTRMFSAILPIWITIGGWCFYFLSLLLFSSFVVHRGKTAQHAVFLTSAAALAILGFLAYRQGSIPTMAASFAVAVGLFLADFEIPLLPRLDYNDTLPLLTLIVNTILGIGYIFFPAFFNAQPNQAGGANIALVLGILFLGTSIFGILLFKSKGFLYAHFPKLIAIPWLVYSIYVAIQVKDVGLLILPACFSIALISTGHIPWRLFKLPPDDRSGHLLFHGISVLTCIILFLFSISLTGTESLFTNWIAAKIQIINIAVLAFNILLIFFFVIIVSVNIAINVLQDPIRVNASQEIFSHPDPNSNFWVISIIKLLVPLSRVQTELAIRTKTQEQEISDLQAQISKDRNRLTQLALLNDLEQQLKPILDPPVVAQLTANTIQKAYNIDLVTVFTYDYPRHEFLSLASAGKTSGIVPPEYRQPMSKGLIGRAARLRKPQYSPDTRLDKDYLELGGQTYLSEAVIPLHYQGSIKGALVVDSEQPNAFSLLDIDTFEAIGALLLSSWNRSNYDDRLRELIRAGINLTTTLETDVVIQEIASMVQQALAARFVFVAMMDQLRVFNRTAAAGYAPKLLNYLGANVGTNLIVKTIIDSPRVHRLLDVRKLDPKSNLDNINLRGFLGFPIKMRGQRIGAILAFGKQGGVYFSEEDESLAALISNQAAASIEMTWLYQQLSTAFNTTTRLYDLSNTVLKTEKLSDAAAAVAEAAYRFGYAKIAGIVLFNPQKEIEAQVQIDIDGLHKGQKHPTALIKQALVNNRVVYEIKDHLATACLPLATPRRQYGVLWLTVPEAIWLNQRYSDDLHTLANQAALALERGILLVETRQQREQILSAYSELETTYDQTLIALSSAVDARDKETEGHCVRVSKLTYHLGKRLGLPSEQLKALERGALLHDIGKIGISDNILLKPGPLNEDEWQAMKLHPDLGARMIEGIPFLQDAIPVIRYHQERWDGSGYPLGLKGEEIPLQARVFAVADVFDALTSTRPYRQRVTINEAVRHIRGQAGVEFDSRIVDALEKLALEGEIEQYLAP